MIQTIGTFFSVISPIHYNFGTLLHEKYQKIDSAVCCSYPKSKKWGTSFEKLNENFLKEDLYKQLGGTIIFCQRIINNFLLK